MNATTVEVSFQQTQQPQAVTVRRIREWNHAKEELARKDQEIKAKQERKSYLREVTELRYGKGLLPVAAVWPKGI